jgi:hypothetical protein
MFNKTEKLQDKLGRNDRWKDRTGSEHSSLLYAHVIRKSNGKLVKAKKIISNSNKRAMELVAKLYD